MKLTIRDLIRLRHCESHYRLGKLGLYAASKRTQFFYQKKDSLILALSKGPTSFSEALEKAFLEYSRDWFLNNRQYETCRDQDLARWHRFADWFFEQGYQILKTRLCSAISVNTSCNHVAVSELSAQADLVLKKGEHVYALSIFPNEPQYSVRARKQETQAYYSLELLSQYLISAPAYGQETISMICYLKSKEDKADFLASQYTEGKCYLQMGYGGIAEATQALLSTIQLSVPQKCEYCRYTDVCHQQNTSALAPEKQPEETSIPVPAETVDLEKGLTPEQRRVVEHMDGPMAVIAVPGAGKTHCLIARMVRMIKNGILPEQILFVTFTKKAAGEILERARRVLGEESALPAIFTFHSLGYTILRKHEDFIGKSLKIAEKVDYYRLILQIIDEISPLSGIDYDGLTGDFGLLSRIYNAVLSIEKDGLEEWKKHADFPDPDGLGCLYQKLKERMKEEGYICFDEQIQLTNQLFSEYPDVLKSYQQRFRYVMIDEFQDISSDQVDLVYAIASHGNIVVVGDDDQIPVRFLQFPEAPDGPFVEGPPGLSPIVVHMVQFPACHRGMVKGQGLFFVQSGGFSVVLFPQKGKTFHRVRPQFLGDDLGPGPGPLEIAGNDPGQAPTGKIPGQAVRHLLELLLAPHRQGGVRPAPCQFFYMMIRFPMPNQ